MNKETYVLVHSAWLGAWSWGYVKQELEKAGHRVVVKDLPGHGEDKTSPRDITMEDYVTAVGEIIEAQEDRVILVGHSFGGMVISQVAENLSEKIKSLVYLTAMLVPTGVSFLDATSQVGNSVALNNLVFAEDKSYIKVEENKLHEAFGEDIPVEIFNETLPLLSAEPTAPLGTKLILTDENFGTVPRYYIQTLRDKAIPVEVQESMFTSMGVDKVFTINGSSHLPIFSNPKTVASILTEIANEKRKSITSEQKASVLKGVISTSSKWKAAFNLGSGVGCAAQYESEAIMVAKPFGTFTGIEEIQAFWDKLIADGFTDVDYIDSKIEVLDENSAILTADWRMNNAKGIITKELFVRQADETFKFREDHFEATN